PPPAPPPASPAVRRRLESPLASLLAFPPPSRPVLLGRFGKLGGSIVRQPVNPLAGVPELTPFLFPG
ncbi:MAG: hypothetical protein M3Q50_09125, partial [Chloroflexota bacterium]|nr:hypothetical protein [Chloroflexota bacterium]